MSKSNLKLDAAETIFFQRELEALEAKMFDVKYAQLKARTLLPTKYVEAGAESYTYRQFDSVGAAKKIRDFAKDFPSVNVKGTKYTSYLTSFGAGFQYTIDEIRAAQKAGHSLDSDRATVARKVIDQSLDTVAAVGDSDEGLKGLTNLASTLDYDPPADGTGSTKTWSTKTADQILRDLTEMLKKGPVETKEVERANRLVLPTSQFEQIKTTRLSNLEQTVWGFLKAQYPYLDIQSWERLTGAGASATDLAVAYDASEEKLALVMAIDFEQGAPQQEGMAFKVPCRTKTGGVVCYFPKSVTYMDGI